MGKYEIEIEKVDGYCVYSYEKGDKFVFNSLKTRDNFCGGAYMVAYPVMSVFEFGGKFEFEENPYCKTKLSCPDNGKVIFKVSKIEK